MEELRAIGVRVPEAELGELAGAFVVERLGRLPRVGDKVELARGAVAEVTAISRRRVTRLRLRIAKEPEALGEGKPAGTEP
jgi:putative hemolysin